MIPENPTPASKRVITFTETMTVTRVTQKTEEVYESNIPVAPVSGTPSRPKNILASLAKGLILNWSKVKLFVADVVSAIIRWIQHFN